MLVVVKWFFILDRDSRGAGSNPTSLIFIIIGDNMIDIDSDGIHEIRREGKNIILEYINNEKAGIAMMKSLNKTMKLMEGLF